MQHRSLALLIVNSRALVVLSRDVVGEGRIYDLVTRRMGVRHGFAPSISPLYAYHWVLQQFNSASQKEENNVFVGSHPRAHVTQT
jgi:hypothetical protein